MVLAMWLMANPLRTAAACQADKKLSKYVKKRNKRGGGGRAMEASFQVSSDCLRMSKAYLKLMCPCHGMPAMGIALFFKGGGFPQTDLKMLEY